MRLQVGQALDRFGHGGTMAGWYPPERDEHPLEALEPLATAAHDRRMIAPIDVLAHGVEIGPDRQVDEDPVVGIGTQCRRVAVLGLQSPDEAGAAIRQRVDLRQTRDEVAHDRPVHGATCPPDVDLG